MNTLETPSVAKLLDGLFAGAKCSERTMRMPHGLDPLSKTTYREFYEGMKDVALPVSRETGRLLYMLVRMMRAETVVEFGTSFGISTIYIAAALRDNGEGRLVTTEFEVGKVARARQNHAEAELTDLVEIREGDALQTLSDDLPSQIDLLLLDGAKGLYLDVVSLVQSQVRPGALILADDTDLCPEYTRTMRLAAKEYASLPITGDVEMSVKLQ